MNITIYLIIILFLLINRTNKKHGIIKEKIKYINYFLFILILTSGGDVINNLIILILNSDIAFQSFKNYEYMPQWLNLIIWICYNIIELTSIILVYYMVQRREKARQLFITILPILLITTIYTTIYTEYELILTYKDRLYIVLLIFVIIPLVIYLPMYYFYTRKIIKKTLFTL